MATKKTTDQDFDQDVLKAEGPVLVDFWAEWCGPCKMIGPVLEDVSTEMEGKLKVVKINIDENPNIPTKFGIRSIPTLIMFKDGKPAAQKVGAEPKARLVQWIQSVM